MDFALALEKLANISQEHLLKDWPSFSTSQQEQLLNQIQKLDSQTFRLQQQMLETKGNSGRILEPFTAFTFRGNPILQRQGESLIAQGKVGCLLVAGGQGTRLGFDGPKGMYPLSLIKNKTLFQIFAEKTLSAGRRAERPLSLAIMTSEENHQTTVNFFDTHSYFGMQKEQIDFFKQGTLPLLDLQGNLWLDSPGHLAEGPDGNGSCLMHFVNSGISAKWEKAGIEKIIFMMVDNPLADPFDSELIGFHAEQHSDMTIKCVRREDPQEKVGILVNSGKKVEVVEYTEISPEERLACDPQGGLKHPCANISLFCFEMAFLKQIAQTFLPLHPAFKEVKKLVGPTKVPTWKFERFIFDVLPFAKKVSALCYPRTECFAPLKNAEGNDSPQTARAALQANDRRILEELTGFPPPSEPFELSQEFYYPSETFRLKWKGRQKTFDGYIE
jgi:UDP-N-acetylglucosamine/UDP-N-acetylgalactosamine diphosphorylase